MKKYTYLILCMFFVALVIAIPELHPQTCHLDGNTLTMLAAGPAFAPLKWNVGQNNMQQSTIKRSSKVKLTGSAINKH